MIRNLLLAAGVLLSASSQLRLPGMPLGPGEACLGLWIGIAAFNRLMDGPPPPGAALVRLRVFWTAFALSLSVGAFVGFQIGTNRNIMAMFHDAEAYVMLAAMTGFCVADPQAARNLYRTGWLLVALAVPWLALQVATGWYWLSLGSADPWYFDRFQGWSENPNQLALYCAALGPLALHLAMTSKRYVGWVLCIAVLTLAIFVGRLTKSDTFLGATVLSCGLLIVLRVRAWLSERAPKVGLRYTAVILTLLASPLLTIVTLPYAMADIGGVENYAKSMAKDQGGEATIETADLRLYLWRHAIAVGLQSGSLGLGPGPHVERTTTLNPEVTPSEAHSTLLDLFTQGGLLADLAIAWLVGGILMLVLRSRLDALVVLVVSIIFFSIFHLIVRHPIVWFALSFCLVMSFERAPTMRFHAER